MHGLIPLVSENRQTKLLERVVFSAKFGGATGCLNAHAVAYPKINWPEFADKFVENALGLVREQYTTQISHYDDISVLCDTLKRINVIFLDFAKDMWTYISKEYFTQQVFANEVGSSAMPHKVNPIDFENAEGNLGIANSLFEHLSAKLPVSRMQRDLTDSTVLRNLGVPIGHTLLSFSSLLRGLSRVKVNEVKLRSELDDNWEVVSEAIQTILRREGVEKPYEKLKALTRTGTKTNQETISKFIDESPDLCKLPKEVQNELKAISPHNFVGVVPKGELNNLKFY